MNPMVRINSAPTRRPLTPETRGSASQLMRRVTVVKVMVWLSFAFGALNLISGLLTVALLAFVSGATLLIVGDIAARDRAAQERLEVIAKELIGLRAQLANSGFPTDARFAKNPVAAREGGTDAATSLLGAELNGHAQPQPAGD